MPRSDPFEEFRRSRIKEARDVDRAPQRRECGAEISGIIDRVTGVVPVPDVEGATATSELPTPHEVEQLVNRLFAELAQSANGRKRELISAFLKGLVQVARRLISEQGRISFSRSEEYETDFEGLFAFMRNPDVKALRRERGLP